MPENDIGGKLLGAALKVHRSLGPGLLESAYEACLAHELIKLDLPYLRQVPVPIRYDGVELEIGYRLDLLVGGLVVVEIKAVERITDVHRAQLGGYRLGYLLNFNVKMLKDGIVRMANAL